MATKLEILTSAAGKLDIEKAWKYDQNQILDWLSTLRKQSQAHGVDRGDKNKAAKDAGPESKTMSLFFAIDYVKHLVASQRITNPFFYTVKQPTDDDSVTEARDYDAVLGGKNLPVRTLFDTIGWILSITAVPADGGVATQNNFYLPLLALFGKWCYTLLPKDEAQPDMIHISWTKEVTIIGATPGGDEDIANGSEEVYAEQEPKKKSKKAAPPEQKEPLKRTKGAPKGTDKAKYKYEGHRGTDVIGARQQALRDLKVPPPPGHERNLVNAAKEGTSTYGVEGSSRYGVCAETFAYIWVGQHKLDDEIPKTKGFALQPWRINFAQIAKFDVKKLQDGLRDPCAKSCQKIIPYFGKKKLLFMLEDMEPLSNGYQPVETAAPGLEG